MSQTTKKALAASLKKLLSGKPLDKITVTDIAEDCGVNRQTFYYHFRDIYDLLEWFFLSEATSTVEGNKTYDTWQQGYLQIFDRMLDNKSFILHTYHSVSKEELEKYLFDITHDFLMEVIEEKAQGTKATEKEKEFIATFYKYGFTGLLLGWIAGGMKEKPDEIIDNLSNLIQGDITKALRKK